MTDGPFKNRKLPRRWKRLADAVHNDADSPSRYVVLASDALVRDLTTAENCSALRALEASSWGQLGLDPRTSVDPIFDSHEKTPLLVKLEPEMQFRMANGSSYEEVLPQALYATVEGQLGEARNRLEEEFIYTRDTYKMSPEACQQGRDKINAAFDAIDPQAICDALRAGNKNAFKHAASKKEGLDEGPPL